MKQSIITPIRKDGIISPTSILVEESEFNIFLKRVRRLVQGTFALIGLYTVLSWMI